MKDPLYETAPMLQFASFSSVSGIPDRTTIMNFRHMLERNQLGRKIFDSINEWLRYHNTAGYVVAEKTGRNTGYVSEWVISERPGKVNKMKQNPRLNKLATTLEKMKSSVRAKVEHPFRVIKCQFGFTKTRDKGLAKNDNQLATLFALSNLVRIDQIIRRAEAKCAY